MIIFNLIGADDTGLRKREPVSYHVTAAGDRPPADGQEVSAAGLTNNNENVSAAVVRYL